MVDPLALWGAVTGTLGVVVGARREYVAGRKRLAIAPGSTFNVLRDPGARLTHGWALVSVWNTGGRALAVERVGFRYHVQDPPTEDGDVHMWEHVAEVALDGERIVLPVDGPSQNVYTPLGPLLAAGVHPGSPLEAFAVTTGGRWWFSPLQPLVQQTAGLADEDLFAGLRALSEASAVPAMAGKGRLVLERATPFI